MSPTRSAALLDVDFVAIALVDEQAGTAEGLLARLRGEDAPWWQDMRVDLRGEPSGIASAVFDGTPVQVYDAGSSPRVSRRLAEAVGAKSGAWIPMVAEEEVIGVLVVATTDTFRALQPEEIALMTAIASEAGLALERIRSSLALRDALDRERLVAEISRKVRSELDVEALMQVAVEETGAALAAARCFIRLGAPGNPLRSRRSSTSRGSSRSARRPICSPTRTWPRVSAGRSRSTTPRRRRSSTATGWAAARR